MSTRVAGVSFASCKFGRDISIKCEIKWSNRKLSKKERKKVVELHEVVHVSETKLKPFYLQIRHKYVSTLCGRCIEICLNFMWSVYFLNI